MTKANHRFGSYLILVFLFSVVMAACNQIPAASRDSEPVQVTLVADGQNFHLTSNVATVRELLAEAGITPGELDEVTPPLFTLLEDDLTITVVRVTESLDVITESLPFERKFVRTDTMSADDAPQIVQAGKNGLQEVTVRIVFRNGLESERVRTNVSVIESPQDELVLIGIGAARGSVNFGGLLAYISGGSAVLMRGSTIVPESFPTVNQLDGRVFSLSPTGSHLLYSRARSNGSGALNNSLWIVKTESGATPRPLGIQNVLWADWNPSRPSSLQIAYTTANPTAQPPGWEANNDLWLADVSNNAGIVSEPEQIVDTYPALNGWWGGNYAWSPNGRFIAYAFANEVGLIDTVADIPSLQRQQLQTFTPYNTLADWVWVPTVTWSPDGRFIAFTNHGSDDEQAMQFNSWIVDTDSPLTRLFVEQTGMWGHMHWVRNDDYSQIAFLKTADPIDSLRSNYTLWLMDQDGSNARQVYPPVGENSAFSRDRQFMAWGPSGKEIAFIFDDDLFILNLNNGEATRVTQDDTISSHPSWAPYGQGLSSRLLNTGLSPIDSRQNDTTPDE